MMVNELGMFLQQGAPADALFPENIEGFPPGAKPVCISLVCYLMQHCRLTNDSLTKLG
jgi:hypothetical protein